MSETPEPPAPEANAPAAAPEPPRHKRRRHLLALAGGAVIVTSVGLAIGPAAPWVVDQLADGQKAGRVGRLRIEGVHGAWLGDLRAEHVALEDEDGVWAEANNVSLKWRPGALFMSALRIDAASAETITISRQPKLTESKTSGGGHYGLRIDRLRIGALHLAEPVFGAAAEFRADAGLLYHEGRLHRLDLDLTRTDSDLDHARWRFSDVGRFLLHGDLESAPGGILARAMGVGEDGLHVTADGEGAIDNAEAHFTAKAGDKDLAQGLLRWDPNAWTLTGAARLDVLPVTSDLVDRFGDHIALEAHGVPQGAFEIRGQTPFLTLAIDGALDEDGNLARPAHVVATTARLSDIAHEAPFEFGAARFEGRFERNRDEMALIGAVDAQHLEILGADGHFAGPVHARLTRQRFALDADLRVADNSQPLFANARLQARVTYDRPRHRFSLDSSRLAGDALDVDARGWVNRGDGEFEGQWRTKKLDTIIPDLTGQGQGQWRAHAEPRRDGGHDWVIAATGSANRIGGAPDILVQLLPGASQVDALLRIEDGGLTVTHARVEGAKLRAAATGRIVRGQSDLSLEASAQGPVMIGDAQMNGAIDATGRLTGAFLRPTVRATANLTSFTAAGIVIDAPVVTFTLQPTGNTYRGQAEMHGQYAGQAVSATSDLIVEGSNFSAPGLIAHLGALEARGEARFSPRGMDAELALSGALDNLAPGLSGRVLGNATLTPETVLIDAQIADARSGDLRIRAANFTASGPYNAIAAHFDMRGRLRQAPLAFTGQALVSATDRGTDVQIAGQGALAGVAIATRTPITAHWGDGAMDAALDMHLGTGAITARWSERARVLQGAATVENAPMAPLGAIWGEHATGEIDGHMELANTGGGLSGNADVRVVDARFAGRQRGTLSGQFTAHLEPTRLTGTIDATSSDGLVAHFEADAPVATSAAPIRIALAPERRGHANWSVHGPASSLWAIARLTDQALDGELNGQGELQFGAGYLAGDGRVEIAHGTFEDKVSGVKLQNLDVAVAIDDQGVNLERFSADDSRGGHITATGGSANPQEGRINLQITDLRFIDRPDARARASGQLDFAWHGLSSNLTGALNIDEADLSIAANPEAGIPTMDVVEINRPGDEDLPEEPVRRTNATTTLDVRINAPGRVFTRGRGVDAEWALDLRLAGTAQAPQLYGQATAVRGTLSLSGQPFEIDTGTIRFNGNPENARINLTATRESTDLTAHILLSGTAADPEISFTSDPALPEDEILPQILFGHSVEDLNAFEAAQLAASLAALSGQASFNLVDAARAAAGLDRFDVREDAAGGLLVAGGVYLTREVYVEVARTGLGQAATRVEWTIRPKLVLITSFLANGDQRVSVRWRREGN